MAILSCLVVSCRVLSCLVVSCRVLSCLVVTISKYFCRSACLSMILDRSLELIHKTVAEQPGRSQAWHSPPNPRAKTSDAQK